MPERKITLNVPEELLETAQRTSGQGVTETMRQGLRLVAAGESFRRVAKLRGRVKFSVNLKKLRDHRRWSRQIPARWWRSCRRARATASK